MRYPRFIPTGVGNTRSTTAFSTLIPVHPHGCGEHMLSTGPAGIESGSSPRVWGTLIASRYGPLHRRFIPTGVGNTIPSREGLFAAAVHPHGCGEHGLKEEAAKYNNRFIPTGVGNTETIAASPMISSVHPHGCGEHERHPARGHHFPGSSPRVWGTRGGDDRLSSHCAVHPHGCGEHDHARIRGRFSPGSSPRVWGTPLKIQSFEIRMRFIPTGVGNTGRHSRSDRDRTVHPHGCGEHKRAR